MTPSRLKLVTLLALAVLGGGIALTASAPWFVVELETSRIEIPGAVAGGAEVAVGLASLAGVAALALAGPLFRIVLALLEAALGIAGAVTAAFALAGPIAASAPVLTDATGVAGVAALEQLARGATATAAPFVALVLAGLLALAGIAAALTSRTWPTGTRRYDRARLGPADEGDAVGDWDALSGGADPTAR